MPSRNLVCRCGLFLQMAQRGISVTIVSPAKTAQPIVMPSGLWTQVGPSNHVLDGVQIPP